MAFVKKTWKDRIAEFPTRRRLTKEDNTSELVTVAREEGTLSQEGDAFSAENMNDLENRIDAEFTEVNGKLVDQSSGKSITLHLESLPCVNRNNVRATTFIPFPFYTINTKYNISFNNIVVSILSYGVLSGSVQIKTKYNNGISVDFNFTSSSNATDLALSGDITITF